MRTLPRPAAMLSIVAISALVVVACQNVGSGSTAPGSGITINVSQTDAGGALSGEGDMTLYLLTTDSATASTCDSSCANTWPPLLGTAAQVTAGDGVSDDFGTITRSDGTQQITHDGHPLYYYGGDDAPGDSNGQGTNDVWFIAPGDATPASAEASVDETGGGPSATPYRAPGY